MVHRCINTKIVLLFLCLNCSIVLSQNRFKAEVNTIQKKYTSLWNKNKETIVVTGSSSIRLWKNLDSLFPNKQIINTGFGGSLSEDLVSFTNELILSYNPSKVFIYEGDNDIAYDKTPKEILKNLKHIIEKINANNAQTKIVLISAKPSIKRWHLKKKYLKFNRKLKRLTKKNAQWYYMDVWKPMVVKNNIPKNIFTSDGLHMNSKGYKIWYLAMKPFMN